MVEAASFFVNVIAELARLHFGLSSVLWIIVACSTLAALMPYILRTIAGGKPSADNRSSRSKSSRSAPAPSKPKES